MRYLVLLKVMHFHYTNWPDHGVPQCPQSIGNFTKEVLKIDSNAPIVVHCRFHTIEIDFIPPNCFIFTVLELVELELSF